MRIDGVTLVALIAIGSFAIERIVKGLLFLLGFVSAWRRAFPDPALLEDPAMRAAAERKNRLIYFVFAGALGIVILAGLGNLRLLYAVGIESNRLLDTILTGLILMGGSDRIAGLLKGAPGEERTAPKSSMEITGRLILEEGAPRRLAATQSS